MHLKKDLVKMKNLNLIQINRLCIYSTPKGINIKTKLTINFMKKMKEYDELRNELNFKLNDNFLYFIMINKTAIILCGGKGTRLGSLSKKFKMSC